VNLKTKRQKGLQFQVILPILLGIFSILLITLFVTERITLRFSEEYAYKRLQAEAMEIEIMLYQQDALTVTPPQKAPQLLFSPPKNLLSPFPELPESLPFAIFFSDNELRSSIVFNIDSATLEKLKGIKSNAQNFQLLEIDRDREFFVLFKKLNRGELFVLLNKKEIPGLQSLELMKEAIAGGGLLILLLTSIILRTNIIKPIKDLINDLNSGSPLRQTGIKELDQLGSSFNIQMKELEGRSERYLMLHKIAVELNSLADIKGVLKNILDYSKDILRAEYAALALYDQNGRFSDLITSGVRSAQEVLPQGKGILQFMQLSLTPVRISDIKTHPAFSGSLPPWHPDIKSFLGYPVFSSNGRPVGALYFANKLQDSDDGNKGEFTLEDESILKAISADIAVAMEREYALEELKRAKRIIDSAFDVIVITDVDGNIVYVNDAFERVTGYQRTEVLGKNPRILKSGLHEMSFYRDLWQTILSGNAWKGEFINKKKSGELYNTSASIFPLFSGSERITHFVSIQRDITEEKKLYEQLLRAQKMEAIGTLASGIAHDFNNILASILGYAELLKDALPEESELFRYADIIDKSAQRGADLAKKILTVTRKEKAEFRSVNLNDIIFEIAEILRKSIPKEITLELKLKEGLPNVRADYSQMSQVIMNLAINAKDAMPDGGRLLIATDIVGSENGAANGWGPQKGANFVKLTVEDTGTGIPQELQSKVFDPFFTTKEPGKGTGLGLYIVHSVVTNHGGYINLYSEPGRGTRFNIYLPVYLEEAPEDTSPQVIDEEVSGTVLIIDDEPYICDLYRDILSKAGFTVFTATNPSEGIRLFKENRIDAVILDLIMPKMSGREVFQILKGLNKEENPKIILSSGYSAELYSEVSTMLSSGAKAFIQKPVSPRTLLLTVKRSLKEG
jgi:PAS domain S-box-containing protein